MNPIPSTHKASVSLNKSKLGCNGCHVLSGYSECEVYMGPVEDCEACETEAPVMMTCMTTKKKFEVVKPEVVVLKNGRYAFRAECPWEGKNGKKLVAFKFCSAQNYKDFEGKKASTSESEHLSEDEQTEAPEEP